MFRPTLGCNISSVTFGNSPANAQTDAGAFIFLLGMQSLEWLENSVEVFFIETDAIILYKNLTQTVWLARHFWTALVFNDLAGYLYARFFIR